ncbi:DNA methyltransferase [Bacteroides hominis]
MINEVYNIDCMKYIVDVPDFFFDLAVIDPPYGIGEDGAKNASRNHVARATNYKPYYGKDKEAPPADFFNELQRVSKNQIIWGANHFISHLPFTADSPCWLVWDKDNGNSHFADCELAWTSFHSAVRKFRYKWNGMLQENMKHKERRIHPNQKPVALYMWLFEKYAQKGYKILDTHVGSGSSRVAAYKSGLDFWGCEIDEYYFRLQQERFINECVMTLDLKINIYENDNL